MKAWMFKERGPVAQVLKLHHDLPQPESSDLQEDELLIRVSHVALFAPEARLMNIIPHFWNTPWTPGWDFSGTVHAVGSSTTSLNKRLNVGDAVFGMTGPWRNGTLTEYIIAPAKCVVSKPANASLEQVAGLSGVTCTAVGIFEEAGLVHIERASDPPSLTSLAQGKRVLITGGSTATGLVLLQLARHLVGTNGEVVTTASPRNYEALQQLGVDEIVDYTSHPQLADYFAANNATKPFDMIIDIAGSDDQLHARSPIYLRPLGCFVFAGAISTTHADPGDSLFTSLDFIVKLVTQVAGWAWKSYLPVILGGVPRRAFFHSGSATAERLELTRQLVEAGVIKGTVDSVWDMDEALLAYDRLLHEKVCGKVTVRVS